MGENEGEKKKKINLKWWGVKYNIVFKCLWWLWFVVLFICIKHSFFQNHGFWEKGFLREVKWKKGGKKKKEENKKSEERKIPYFFYFTRLEFIKILIFRCEEKKKGQEERRKKIKMMLFMYKGNIEWEYIYKSY